MLRRPGGRVVDEDGLAERQLGRDALPLGFRHLPSVKKKSPEWVAPLALVVDEDAKYMQGGHGSILGANIASAWCRFHQREESKCRIKV